jgi:hypothetical protein
MARDFEQGGQRQSGYETRTGNSLPACVDAETAARYLGWPTYFMALLARAGHLRPLGKPAQNARKWYAMVELERVSRDADWLDKAVRIVERSVQEAGRKQKGQGQPALDP